MSYFAGLGAGKGWHTFKFIITPEEFESIFYNLNFHFVITNSRVEIKYKETSPVYIFDGYEAFFNKIIIKKNNMSQKKNWTYERKIRISVTDDISKINFIDICDQKGVISPEFKLVRPSEPVINISPFFLTYSKENENLSVSFFNTSGTIGLELTYPKFVSFENDGFTNLIDAQTYNNYKLFNDLVKRIKALSGKAKLQSNLKLYRPNFCISEKAKKSINENHYLKDNGLTIF